MAPALIVAIGQIRNREGLQRVGVLDVSSARRVRVVRDEWHADPATLARELGASLGHWDVMHSTRWMYAWHEGRLWDRRGLRARVLHPHVIEVRKPMLARGDFTRLVVASVRARLDKGWLVRTVTLVDRSGNEHVVARKRELSVVIDPVYDGIDLMMDAAWCSQLAQSLAGALEVPCAIDEDLR